MKRIVWVAALVIAGLLSMSLALKVVYPRLTATTQPRYGPGAPVELPWRFDGVRYGSRLQVHVRGNAFTPRRWRIIPDDRLTSLTVNGLTVPLDDVPTESLTDWYDGFEIDLSGRLHGDDELTFTLDNTGGPGGLTLRPVVGWRSALLALGMLPWLLALTQIVRLRRLLVGVLCGALVVICAYWGATPWNVRSYDVKFRGETGHLDYVAYVAEKGGLPQPNEGWQYYQPPLYYEGGALAWRWASALSVSPHETLRAYSVFLWLVFLSASAAAIDGAARRAAWVKALAVAGVALWPSGIMAAPRIGNDAAIYAAAGIATWWMVRWWRSGRRLHLAWMSLAIALAFLCKSNAAVLFAAALALVGLRMLRRSRWRRAGAWVDASVLTVIGGAGAALSLGRNVYYWWHGKLSSWLVSNISGLDANLRGPRDVRSFIPLDLPVFLTSPWVDSRDDATGRTNFWNYLLRSALSGEFTFEGDARRAVSLLWGVLLLGLVLLVALGAYRRRPSIRALWRDAPWIVLGLLWLLSILYSRLAYPFPCTGDFRYIFPFLVPLVLACIRRGPTCWALLSLVALSSAAFFLFP
jgi:hypothetical protein